MIIPPCKLVFVCNEMGTMINCQRRISFALVWNRNREPIDDLRKAAPSIGPDFYIDPGRFRGGRS